MKITGIKTHKITQNDADLFGVLDRYISSLKENSVVAVTSKIVSICEGRLVKMEGTDKDKLIKQEAQFYIPRKYNKFNITVTIAHNIFGAGAGIDESNGNGYYILWPKDSQKSANAIRKYLREKFGLKNLGVIITDSKTTPMRWGVTGIAIAHSGFLAVKNYINTPDLFGRKFAFEMLSVRDTLASAAVQVMGEGSEQIPLAIVEDIPNITFQDKDPSKKELDMLSITLDKDLFGMIIKKAPWEKGEKNFRLHSKDKPNNE